MRFLLEVYCGSDRPTGIALEVLLDCESMLRGYKCWVLGTTVHQSTYIDTGRAHDSAGGRKFLNMNGYLFTEMGLGLGSATFPIRSRSRRILGLRPSNLGQHQRTCGEQVANREKKAIIPRLGVEVGI